MSGAQKFGALVITAAVGGGCGPATAPEPDQSLFEEATAAAGVQHEYRFRPGTPAGGKNFGGGAVAEDLDGDGYIDLYVSNGFGPKSLFWNNGDGTFTEGSGPAGAAFPEDWTTGVAAADIDNDGDQDLFLVNGEEDRLLLNEGQRRFRDAGRDTGLALPLAGHGASFGDIDGDGWLDLFVGASPIADTEPVWTEGPHPMILPFALAKSNLLLSNRNLTWRDVTDEAVAGGIPEGNPFVGALIDLDADFDLDLILIQDAQNRTTNRLFENLGSAGPDGVRFREATAACGCEAPLAGMGLAVLDVDNNGLPDLYVTNLLMEWPNREALLVNRGGLVFEDVTEAVGATAMDGFSDGPTRAASWAAMTLDVENDGREDLFVVYAPLSFAVEEAWGDAAGPETAPNQPDALLRAGPDGMWTVAQGSGVEDPGMAHSAVVADFDGDGCEDIYVVNLEAPARLYRNRCANAGHFIDLRLVGTRTNRDAIGAKVRIQVGERVLWRQVLGCSTGSHSCMPKRLHVGLGEATEVDRVDILWPSGAAQSEKNLMADRLHTLVEPAVPRVRIR